MSEPTPEILSQLIERIEWLEKKVKRMSTVYDKYLSEREKLKVSSDLAMMELPPLLAKIINVICKDNNTSIESLLADRNGIDNQTARHEIHFILKKFLNDRNCIYPHQLKMKLTLKNIGAITDHHHSSVLNSIGVINNLCETNAKFKAKFDDLVSRCEAIILEEIKEREALTVNNTKDEKTEN